MPDSVTVLAGAGWRATRLSMKRRSGYTFEAEVPAELIRQGYFYYYIEVASGETRELFPKTDAVDPSNRNGYQVSVSPKGKKLFIFNAYEDGSQVSRVWRPGAEIIPTGEPARAELITRIDKLFVPDPEDKDAEAIYDYSMRFNFHQKIGSRPEPLDSFSTVHLKGRSLNGKSLKVQLAFITRSGATAGGLVDLRADGDVVTIDRNTLRPVKMVILPRPYPSFLPYYFSNKLKFDWSDIETFQISVGPGLSNEELESNLAFAIEMIWLE